MESTRYWSAYTYRINKLLTNVPANDIFCIPFFNHMLYNNDTVAVIFWTKATSQQWQEINNFSGGDFPLIEFEEDEFIKAKIIILYVCTCRFDGDKIIYSIRLHWIVTSNCSIGSGFRKLQFIDEFSSPIFVHISIRTDTNDTENLFRYRTDRLSIESNFSSQWKVQIFFASSWLKIGYDQNGKTVKFWNFTAQWHERRKLNGIYC